MADYKKEKIKNLCSIQRIHLTPQAGTTYTLFSLPAFDNSKTPEVVDGKAIMSGKLTLTPNTILYNKLNVKFRRVWKIKELPNSNSICSPEYIPLKANKGVDQDYLYYHLISSELTQTMHGARKGTSCSQQRIDADALLNYEIPVPSIDEQKKIAGILLMLDERIENNRSINHNLQQQAEALFDKIYNSATEKALFSEFVQLCGGGTPKTDVPSYWNGSIPFFSPKDVGSLYCLSTEKNITESGLNNCNSNLFPINTVFVTARGTVGKVNLAGKPMAMNQSCYALVGKGIDQLVVHQLALKTITSLKQKATGAVFDAITTRDFNSEIVNRLSETQMDEFVSYAHPLYSSIMMRLNENNRLSTLRDTLLPKLMSGEIDVSNVEI